MDGEAARAHLLARPEAREDFPFGPDVYVYKIGPKMFATLSYVNGVAQMNLKCEPNEAMALRVFQALESAAADPTTRALLPDETIELLLDLRRWFLPPGDSGSDIDQIQDGGGV